MRKLLENSFAKGIGWNAIAAFCLVIGNLAQLSILTKLLTKGDLGLMAVVEIVCAIALRLAELGLSSAILHKQFIPQNHLSGLFALQLWAGVFFAALLYGFGDFVANFYGSPTLLPMLHWVALGVVIAAVGTQYRTLMMKAMQFDRLALVDVVGFYAGFAVSVALALKGCGANALVWGYLTKLLISNSLLVIFGAKIFVPIKPLRNMNTNLRPYLSLGAYQSAANLIDLLSNQSDTLIIGKVLGLEAAGVYNAFKSFLQKPLHVVNPVLMKPYLPFFATIQGQTSQVAKQYHDLLRAMAKINAFIYMLLFVGAGYWITLIFNSDWIAYQSIFSILCVFCFLYATVNPVGALLVSHGAMRLQFWWNVWTSVAFALMLALSAPFGLDALVWAVLGYQVIVCLAAYFFIVKKFTQTKFHHHFFVALKPLLFAAISIFLVKCLHISNLIVDIWPKYGAWVGASLLTACIYCGMIGGLRFIVRSCY